MKTIYLKLALVFLISWITLNPAISQEQKKKNKITNTELTDLNGKKVKILDIINNPDVKKGPIIISFWATWCKPCIKELTSIAEVYEDWQKETNVRLIAVSIDDARTSAGVKTLVNGKNWDYIVLQDVNGDFKRAMGVNMVPHTFLLNADGEVVWQHTSFSEGSELELIELVRKVAKGEEIKE